MGSIREVDTYSGNNRTVVQKTQYYPSGTPFADSFGAGGQAYKFTGKEMITMHGLNWQDFGARWLDNARMQWTSMDPLAEQYYSISPYAYCHNNPVNRIDPDGRKDDDKTKTEFKIPNLSEIVHGVLATFGCDPQVPITDSKQSLEESRDRVDQQAETRDELKEASKDALIEGAHKTADALETTGTVIQGAGYVLAPVTEGASLSFIPIGKTVESGGSFINGALDISEGKTGKAAANLASTVAFGTLGRKVEKLSTIGKIAKYDNVFLQLIIDVHAKITSLCTNFISDKK